MKSLRKHEDFRWKLVNHKNTNRSFLRDPIKPFRECCSRVPLTSGILYYEIDSYNSKDATYYARKVHGLISGCKIHTGRWMADIQKHCQKHNGPRILSPKLELSLKAVHTLVILHAHHHLNDNCYLPMVQQHMLSPT